MIDKLIEKYENRIGWYQSVIDNNYLIGTSFFVKDRIDTSLRAYQIMLEDLEELKKALFNLMSENSTINNSLLQPVISNDKNEAWGQGYDVRTIEFIDLLKPILGVDTDE